MRRLFFVLLISSTLIAGCDLVGEDDETIRVEERQVPFSELVLDSSFVVTPNPSGIAPLTAVVEFATVRPARVSLTVLGEIPVHRRVPALDTEHRATILGLYADRENQVVLRVDDPETGFGLDTLTIVTEPLDESMPTINIVTVDTARMEDGMTLAALSIAKDGEWLSVPTMFDSNGDVRWYLNLSEAGGTTVLAERFTNGHLKVGYERRILEYDMLGYQKHAVEFPDYWYHHDVIEKPDGNLLVAVDVRGRDTIEDHVIEIDRTTGAVVNEWDLREILDVHRLGIGAGQPDWFHMNAIWYDEDDDALILSGRNQGVIKVTRDNELVWILAPHKDWGRAGVDSSGYETSDYLLTAVDDTGTPYPEAVQMGDREAPDFDWPWGQHTPEILPNGNYFLFDNGARRFWQREATHSRGVEYVIDEENMTVRQVWQYGRERGQEFFSGVISDVDYLPTTGNRLIMPGIATVPVPRALVTEVTYPEKDVVFEASIEFKNLNGTGQGWGQADIVYRSERLPLYP